MRATVVLLSLFVGVFAAFLFQEALPAVDSLYGARVLFVPAIFCYAAMGLPFPVMLVAAVYTGFLTDLMYLHVVGGQVEIALGWSIVYFVALGCLSNGFRPGMLRGHWWPAIPLGALGTSALLFLQFVMISLRREGFVFEESVVWRIIAPGLLAAIFVPILHMAARAVRPLFYSLERTPGIAD